MRRRQGSAAEGSAAKTIRLKQHRETFPPPSAELAEQIGRIIMEWSALEAQLDWVIGALLDVGSAAKAVIGSSLSNSTRAKVGLVTGLVNLLDQPVLSDQWRVLSGEIDALRIVRNEVAHSTYEQDHFRDSKAREHLRVSIKQIDISALHVINENIIDNSIKLSIFFGDLLRVNAHETLRKDAPPGLRPPII